MQAEGINELNDWKFDLVMYFQIPCIVPWKVLFQEVKFNCIEIV